MNDSERRRRRMAWLGLYLSMMLVVIGHSFPAYALGAWVGAAFASRWAVDLLAEAPRVAAHDPDDFGQREPELDALRTVYACAYRWRYAFATNADVDQATEDLIDAVDQWDIDRPHHPNGGPL